MLINDEVRKDVSRGFHHSVRSSTRLCGDIEGCEMNIRINGVEKNSVSDVAFNLIYPSAGSKVVMTVKDDEGDVVIVGGCGRHCHGVLSGLIWVTK